MVPLAPTEDACAPALTDACDEPLPCSVEDVAQPVEGRAGHVGETSPGWSVERCGVLLLLL